MPGVAPGVLPYLNAKRQADIFEHQLEHLLEYRDAEYRALFWQTGCAKTLPVIATAAHLYLQGRIELFVLFAPNTVHENWWKREVPATLDPGFPILGYVWDSADATKRQQEIQQRFLHATGKLKMLCVNFEAFSAHRDIRKNRAVAFVAAVMDKHRGKIMGAVDEADGIGDPSRKRSKRTRAFGLHMQYRRIATGTPITESPFSAYAQAEFLKPGVLGCSNYETFTQRYGIFKTKKFGTGKSFQSLEGYRNLPDLKARLAAFADFKKKAECLDLPEKLYEIRNVPLTREQREAYDQMRILKMHALARPGEDDTVIMARSSMQKLSLMHDIVVGFTRMPDPTWVPDPAKPKKKAPTIPIPLPTNRLDVLDETIATLEGKVIIFSSCLPAVKLIVEHLSAMHGAHTVMPCYGAISRKARNDAQDMFQDPNSPVRFFVANPETGGVGLTLTAAQTVIFYSNGYRLRMRLQAEDRAHRPGQVNKVTYIDLVSPDTVDEKFLKSQSLKVNIASQVVELFDYFMGEKVMTDEELLAYASDPDSDEFWEGSEQDDLFATESVAVDVPDATLSLADTLRGLRQMGLDGL